MRAVDFIHKSNIIHRDIKPANILIQEDLSIKICDFGLARSNPNQVEDRVPRDKASRKELGHRLNDSRHERKKQKRCLSPHVYSRIYRPPEVALLEPDYSFSADIWSVGCVLAELLYCLSSRQEGQSSSELARYLFKSISCYPLSPKRGP